MDEIAILNLISKCKLLKYKFRGIYPADKFPVNIANNTFVLVNASKSNNQGTHWLLILKKNQEFIFADPLGQGFEQYQNILQRMYLTGRHFDRVISFPVQPLDSPNCGLYCLYIAHCMFSYNKFYFLPFISETQLFRFVKHMY